MAGRHAVGVDVQAKAGVVLKKRPFQEVCPHSPCPRVWQGRITGRGGGIKLEVQLQFSGGRTLNPEHGARALFSKCEVSPQLCESWISRGILMR